MITTNESQLVRQTLERLREMARPVSLLFYGRLFELDPAARTLFHNDLALQGRKFVDMLQAVADSLDRFDAVRPRLTELGRQHAAYGVRPEQYETATQALLWALGQAVGPDFDAPTRAAWRHLLTTVSEAMLADARLP
jgi:hemoglobin-like flavoprotein